ncbi:MAG: ABC transporter permease [Ardenticatenaceae bacterium]|nr:ABC transporter permease [Ardenticatenaceae bacterium]
MATASPTISQTEEKSFLRDNWILLSVLGVTLILILYFYNQNAIVTTAVLAAALRQSTPLVLGAMCGILCERSGIVNIGIEGTMLLSAFVGFITSFLLQDALGPGAIWVGVVIGVLSGGLMGLLLAWMSVTLRMDQIIGGTVINILAVGLTGYFYQQGLTAGDKLRAIPLGPLADIPLIGRVFFDNPPLTYLTLLLIVLVHLLIYYTRWGLRTRAVGEHPRAADTVGVNVYKIRYVNVILGSCLAGLAGAYLTLEAVGSFERLMTNGRGFIALAVMLFGKRTPFGAWGAALLFGFATALNTQLQFADINIPHQFVGLLPFVLTILVVAGLVGRTRDPKALGTAYSKE